MPVAYISMGSNLENPPEQLDAAMARIARIPGVTIDAISATYITEPQGCIAGTTWFHNRTLRVFCLEETPESFLKKLQAIEQEQGRVRSATGSGIKNLPRTIDLDLLLFDDEMRQSPELTIPHPRMTLRAFVLVPLAEVLLPGFVMPGDGRSISELLSSINYTITGKQIWQPE